MSEYIGPHGFEPLKFKDRFVKDGRCKECFFIRESHPIEHRCVPRPEGDESKAIFE